MRYISQYKQNNFDLEKFKEYFHYDKDSGVFTVIKKNCKRILLGTEAGTIDKKGYRVIQFGGSIYKAHRLAWIYVHGVWPSQVIDHINGNRSDNRLVNLREASHGQNKTYSKPTKTNTSGKMGVSKRTFNSGTVKWAARININHKQIHLGYFNTYEEAVKVRLQAEDKYYKGFTNRENHIERQKR